MYYKHPSEWQNFNIYNFCCLIIFSSLPILGVEVLTLAIAFPIPLSYLHYPLYETFFNTHDISPYTIPTHIFTHSYISNNMCSLDYLIFWPYGTHLLSLLHWGSIFVLIEPTWECNECLSILTSVQLVYLRTRKLMLELGINTIIILVQLLWYLNPRMYIFIDVCPGGVGWDSNSHHWRLVPAQDVLFALILWYVAKTLFRS